MDGKFTPHEPEINKLGMHLNMMTASEADHMEEDEANETDSALETTPSREECERVLMLIHSLKPTMVMAFYFNIYGQ